MACLEVRDRRCGKGRRLGEDPGARQGSDAEPRGKNARFAAGLDKPKIIETAPAPTKADAKKKADAKEEARLAPKTDRKPTNPAGKAS